MRKFYVTAMSNARERDNVRGCIIELYADYNSAKDVGEGGPDAFMLLRAMFADAIKNSEEYCNDSEDFTADKIQILGVTPLYF